ncbi:hypothetical protein [Kordiimonas sp.]|uniref:hypothetical protein n=1 Tax=Kordiimonas sp. TaxID=1970157 RepID=UPI003A8CAFFA
MDREQSEKFLKTLAPADSNFVEVGIELIEIREKAVLIESMTGIHAKRVWIPRSQVAFVDRGNFGLFLAVKRWWVNKENLWWMKA